jgi:putative transcriptional regulator
MSQPDFPSKTRAVKTSQDSSFDLTGHFLLAMPAMADPTFNNSVIYLVEHNAKGAMGIVVNQPMRLSVADLFKRLDLTLEHDPRGSAAVLIGGPVHNDRGFVLHRPHGAWSSTLQVNDEVGLTSSKDILEAVANGAGPPEFLLALGYSGWGAGQHGSQVRQSLAVGLLGVDPVLLSSQVGHA